MRCASARPGRPGFTLIELLVVVAILGMAAAAAAPALRSRAAGGAAQAAAELAGAYATARSVAVGRGLTVTVHLEPATRSYAVLAQPAPGAALDTLRAGVLDLSRGARVLAGPDGHASAVFEPLGRARVVPVTIEDNGRTFTVAVDEWTAEPTILAR